MTKYSSNLLKLHVFFQVKQHQTHFKTGNFHKTKKHTTEDIKDGKLTDEFWKRVNDKTPDQVLQLQQLSIAYNLEVARVRDLADEYVVVLGCNVIRRKDLRFKEVGHFSEFLKAYASGVAAASLPQTIASIVNQPVLSTTTIPVLQPPAHPNPPLDHIGDSGEDGIIIEESGTNVSESSGGRKLVLVACPMCGKYRHQPTSTCEFAEFINKASMLYTRTAKTTRAAAARDKFLELKQSGVDWRTLLPPND